jgi:cell division protein FtsI (penicillin-binding protein 3)
VAKVSNTILIRVYLLFGLFVLFGGLIMLRVSQLQVQRDLWVQKEIDEQVYFHRVVANRGNILAEDGSIMATSLPFYRIAMDVTVVDTAAFENFRDSLLLLSARFANYFDPVEKDTLSYFGKVMTAIAEHDRHVYLSRKPVNFKELEMIQEWPILNGGRYKGGLVIEKLHNKRYFPYGELAQITLGRLVNDTMGIRGIEHSFNTELRGEDGFILAQKIAGSTYIPLDNFGEDESIDGMDVHTTIDVDLQDVVEKALREAVIHHKAKFGTAILLEAATGQIKALANYPETYNYAIATQIEPGSTFKLASAVAALEEHVIGMDDTVDTGNGIIQYEDKQITDSYGYGKLPFRDVFAKSSNVGVSKVIYEGFARDPKRFLSYIEKFGFYSQANTQIQGEPKPVVITPGSKHWNGTTLPSMAIGYSIRLTPIEIVSFYNAIANGGKLMQPYIVRQVTNGSKVVREFEPVVLRERICSEETVEMVHELLKGVVQHGTARNIRDSKIPLAGKTGTARKAVNGKYRDLHQASFAGFFPADNPRYTCYVMLDEPSSGQIYGAQVAAPVFKQIAEEIYAMDMRLSEPIEKKTTEPVKRPAPKVVFAQAAHKVFKEFGIETSRLPEEEWVRTRTTGHQINYEKLDLKEGTIPDVRGMSARDAMHLLEESGLQVRLRGSGKVKRQSLLPGYRIGKNTSVTLFLG